MALKVIASKDTIPRNAQGACIAIIPPDGIHKGHLRVITAAAAHAQRLQSALGVLTFDPTPGTRSENSFKLMSIEQKARCLDEYSVDFLFIVPPQMWLEDKVSADFAQEILSKRLKARHVTVGLEARKGEDAPASVLIRNSANYSFSISILNGGQAVREGMDPCDQARGALGAGRPEVAAEILGRPFAIEGVVTEGKKLGRKLGYPTANIPVGDYVRPRFGVYATRSYLWDGREVAGVSSFGVNPTTGLVEPRLEVHLFDFDEEIYGRTIETELVSFLRPEVRFDGLEELKAQISRDANAARLILDERPKLVSVKSKH